MINENTAQLFFSNYSGQTAESILVLPQSGSSRINCIIESKGQKYILTSNENTAENNSFLYFSEVFSSLQLNTPVIYAVAADRKMYLQEFVGTDTLSEIIQNEPNSDRVEMLVRQSLDELYHLQKATENKIDYTKTFEYKEYNRFPIQNDLFYFKNMFVDVLELPYHKATLLQEFENLTKIIVELSPKMLMIRDFQARNIMVNEKNKVYFIDYQSAMEGPAMYDVISFLFQAKANFTADFKEKMLNYYINLWGNEHSANDLRDSIQPLQLIRYLQVLGAYGFRGLIQKKQHFISSIDKGIENLQSISQNWKEMKNYPELQKLILSLNTMNIDI